MTQDMPTPTVILPAEYVGTAAVGPDGLLRIGEGGRVVAIPLGRGWQDIDVYVRRRSTNLSVIEIAMATHDGLAQEELDHQNAEADRYPLGPREYWRGQEVGKCRWPDGHLLTDAEFDAEWDEAEAWDAEYRAHRDAEASGSAE